MKILAKKNKGTSSSEKEMVDNFFKFMEKYHKLKKEKEEELKKEENKKNSK